MSLETRKLLVKLAAVVNADSDSFHAGLPTLSMHCTSHVHLAKSVLGVVAREVFRVGELTAAIFPPSLDLHC